VLWAEASPAVVCQHSESLQVLGQQEFLTAELSLSACQVEG
jgi:hypothetical protein